MTSESRREQDVGLVAFVLAPLLSLPAMVVRLVLLSLFAAALLPAASTAAAEVGWPSAWQAVTVGTLDAGGVAILPLAAAALGLLVPKHPVTFAEGALGALAYGLLANVMAGLLVT